MANKETRVFTTDTLEVLRQKTNDISLHLGDNELFNVSLTDKVYNYNSVSAGELFFSGSDDNSKIQKFNIKTEETIDNTGGYIILTGSPSITGFVAGGTVSQSGGYSATIVSSSTARILVKNSSGTFSTSQNLTIGSDAIAHASIVRIIAESFNTGVVRVYKNGTEVLQNLEAAGFHVANYAAVIPLLNTPTLTNFIEGTTAYQGSNLANATFSGTILDASSTKLRLKTISGSFNASNAIKVDGSASTITGANHGAAELKDITIGNIIVLNTPAAANDNIKVFSPSLVDSINELQDDVGITENLTTAATNISAAINEIEAVFDASTHEISSGSTAFSVTSGEFTIDSSADIILDADGGDIRLKDGGTQYANLAWGTGNNLVIQSGSTTMLTGAGANATFSGTLDVDGNFEVGASKFNVTANSGNTQIDGSLTVDGIVNVGQLNTKFSNRNNVKLALNELHDEMGTASITGTGTPAAGLSNLTDGLNAIDAEIGATSYLAGSGVNATITYAVDAIQDYVGAYSSGTPVVNTVSSTITGGLNQLHIEMGSSTLVDNLPSDYTYTVTDHTTAINTLSAFAGNSSIASIGSTDTLSGAIVQLHGEIGDGSMTGLAATNISAAVRELESEKVYLSSGTQQEFISKLGLTGDVTFKDGGSNANTFTFNSGTTLDISSATLLLPGSASNVNRFGTSFLEVDGNVETAMGFRVNREHVTQANKSTVNIQWDENHTDGTSATKLARGWQLKGLNDAGGSHTTDIVTFYNAKELITSNAESGINVTWDASNENFDFNVNDPTLTFTGDVTGTGTLTNLGNLSVALTVAANSVALTTDTTGDYVRTATGTTNQITVSGSGTEGRATTYSIPSDFRMPGTAKVLSSTGSSSPTTGALTVAGGVGIGEDLYIAGNLHVAGDTVTLNTSTLTVEDTLVLAGNGLGSEPSSGGFGLEVGPITSPSGLAAGVTGAHSIVYNYGTDRWEADGSLILSSATLGSPKIEGSAFEANDNLLFSAGTGLSEGVSVSGVNTTVTYTNTDKGSSQAIFKNIAADSGGTTTANINNDTLTLHGGTALASVRSGDTITFNHDNIGLSTSVNNSDDGTYIRSLAVNSQGHVTSIVSGDFDNYYDLQANSVSTNTVNKVVKRDGSGDFSARIITASLSGNATTATSSTNAAKINIQTTGTSGNYRLLFKGAQNETAGYHDLYQDNGGQLYYNPATNTLTSTTFYGALTGNASTATYATSAGSITGQANSATITSTSGNTGNQIVSRNGNGDFSARIITATLSGNATTATTAVNAGTCTGNSATATKVFVNNYSGGTTMRILGSHDGINSAGNVYSTPQVYVNMSTNNLYATTFTGALTGHASSATSATYASKVTFNTQGNSNTTLKLLLGDPTNSTVTQGTIYKDASLSFNCASNTLYAGVFSGAFTGALTGNASTATTAASCSGNSASASTSAQVTINYNNNSASNYQMLWGSGNQVYGTAGVVVNANTNTITASTFSGSLSGNATTATNAATVYTRAQQGNANYRVPMVNYVSNSSGYRELTIDSGGHFYYNPSSNILYAGTFSGAVAYSNLTGTPTIPTNNNQLSNGQGFTTYSSNQTLNNNSNVHFEGLMVGQTSAATANTIRCTGDVVAFYASDERLKENIKVLENGLDKVCQLRGVEFDWNDKQDVYEGHDIGVIAQDVEKVAPELVETRKHDGYKAVKYEKLTALLIEAVKELKEENKSLRAEFEALKSINT